MKKTAIFFAMLAGVLAVSSCKQNTEPRLEPATEFVLNTPALATQYFNLEDEGSTLSLDWSQPNWGVSLVASYNVQMSFSKDFTAYEADGQSYAAVYDLPDTYTACNATISAEQVAVGMCSLRGIRTDADYTDEPARSVYFRVVASVPGVEGTEIISNVVEYTQLKGYCAVPSPGRVFLVGAPEGWKGPDAVNADHYAAWALSEDIDAIGSKVYYGTFNIPAGSAMFRFYTALTGWDNDSYGSQVDDNALDFAFTNNEFQSKVVKGKGSFNFPDWTTDGVMDMTLNMKDMQIIIKATR